MSDKNIEAVEKILGEPIFIEFSDYIRKIRTSLLIVSSITAFILSFNIEIGNEILFLGLKIKNSKIEWILNGLFILNFYLFLHFLLCSIDSFKEWRIRVTGTKVAHVTGAKWGDKDSDRPDNPRQSTLYNWWKDRAGIIGYLKDDLDSINEEINKIETEIQTNAGENIPPQNLNNALNPIASIKNSLATLKNRLDETDNTLQSSRITVSLGRFDNCFRSLLNTQNFRWLVVEFLFPLFLSAMELIFLSLRLYNY